MRFQARSPKIASIVVRKNAKKAEANESSRLWNKLKPSNGKPRNVPPGCRCVCAECIIRKDLSRLEYSFMPSSAQIELWPAERVAAKVLMLRAANGLSYSPWGETRIAETDLERLVDRKSTRLNSSHMSI